MGIWVLQELLGVDGYFSLKQSSLKAMILMTGDKCWYEKNAEFSLDLPNFEAIQQLTWIATQNKFISSKLGKVSRKNSKHLTHLRLQKNEWWFDGQIGDEDLGTNTDREALYNNVFAYRVMGFGKSIASSTITLPALTYLSLEFISLKDAQEAMIRAFNFFNRSDLTLNKCPSIYKKLRQEYCSSNVPYLVRGWYCELMGARKRPCLTLVQPTRNLTCLGLSCNLTDVVSNEPHFFNFSDVMLTSDQKSILVFPATTKS